MLRDMKVAEFGFKLRIRFTFFFNFNVKICTVFIVSASSRRLFLGLAKYKFNSSVSLTHSY